MITQNYLAQIKISETHLQHFVSRRILIEWSLKVSYHFLKLLGALKSTSGSAEKYIIMCLPHPSYLNLSLGQYPKHLCQLH